MKLFADHCASNLSRWSARCKELENANQADYRLPLATSPRHPDDFMTVFPLTLPLSHRSPNEDPVLVWPTLTSQSSESSCGSSESNPCSPNDSLSSFLFSPASDSSHFNPNVPPSSASSTSSYGYPNGHITALPNGHAAIRAAGKLGIRKQRSMNRNSWSPFSTSTHPRPVAVAPISVPPSTPGPAKPRTNAILVNKPIKLERNKLGSL